MQSVRRAQWAALLVSALVVPACSDSPDSPTGPTSACTLTIPQTSINVGFAGGANSVLVSTTSACAWNATTTSTFLTLTTAGMTGPGSLAFTVAENTGEARQGTITIGSVVITVNQAAAPPPIVFTQSTLPSATVGAAYSQAISASGGVGTLRYSIQPGTFLPQGLSMDAGGRVSGTPSAPGTSTFGACVADDSGRSICRGITLVVNPPGTSDSPILGNWAGTITVTSGCVPGLPQTVAWSGIFRRASNNNLELLANIPFAQVSNAVVPVSVSGTSLTFNIQVDSRYEFRATFTSDFRSLTGTFSGANCAPPPLTVLPGGTWTGTKQ